MVVLAGVLHVVLSEWLVAEEVIAAEIVAELLEEAEDVCDAVDRWQVQRVLLMIEHSWRREE